VCAEYLSPMGGRIGRVVLTMELIEVKYGFSTNQERSNKVKLAIQGLREINALLAAHAEKYDSFPSCIASATQTFVYLGPHGRTAPGEIKAFAEQCRAAADVGLKIRVEKNPRTYLSRTLAALLIDQDAVLPDQEIVCSAAEAPIAVRGSAPKS
jgi:hypothetical protein